MLRWVVEIEVMPKQSGEKELNARRHTAAHVLAAASQQLRPETRLGAGPAIEDGFYHDVDVDSNYSEDDLALLEKKMEEIKKMDLPVVQRRVTKKEARELFQNDPYKLELIDDITGERVGVSDMGDGFFVTLCEGGHAKSTGEIGFLKLTRLAGVYWRGDESKPQLQRIYGVSFPTKKELKGYLDMLEEARRRDHRKLGKELDLFTFSPLVGSGLPLFTPRGTIVRQELENFVQSLQEPRGYQRVTIPHIAKSDLYKTSGHWDKFSDDIFRVRGKHDAEFVVKPMNCPHHTQIYAAQKRSYKELPLRFSEVTTVYRDEQAGELQGLTRVRSITQDDGHVFCRPDQIQREVKGIMKMIKEFYDVFRLGRYVVLSLRDPATPEKYLGDDAIWQKAERALRDVMAREDVFGHDEPRIEEGEATFYGPKIDYLVRDSLRREWQLATIQVDFNMPQRFGLTYTDEEGKEQTPVMIHRAISGSLERFMAILLEHYAGALPLWLSPVQVAVLAISDEQLKYARRVAGELREAGIRVEVDNRSESIGKKIREAEMQKVPVMLIVGKKEVEANTVAVRTREDGDGDNKKVKQVIEELTGKISKRA